MNDNSIEHNITDELRCQLSGLFNDEQLLDENQPSGFSKKSDDFLSTVAILLNQILRHLHNNGGNEMFDGIANWGNEVLKKLDSIDKKLDHTKDNESDFVAAIEGIGQPLQNLVEAIPEYFDRLERILTPEQIEQLSKNFYFISKNLHNVKSQLNYLMKAQDPTVRLKTTVNDDGNGEEQEQEIPPSVKTQRNEDGSERIDWSQTGGGK